MITNFQKIIKSNKQDLKNAKEEPEVALDQPYDLTNLDENCLYDLSANLVRIEYPGLVRNVDRAVETMQGQKLIESAVADHKLKLELRFHPKNRFNKGCVADKDPCPGILIKVTKNKNKDTKIMANEQPYKYEVVGVTTTNFKFSRLIDFQYLPLIPQRDKDGEECTAEYIYDKILPEQIPDMEWFMRKENLKQKLFITPYCFARFNLPNKLYVSTTERYSSSSVTNYRPEMFKFSNRQKRFKFKHISIFVDLSKPDVIIPCQPRSYTMELIKGRCLEQQYEAMKKMFQERPIWTKAAILCNSKISLDLSKIIVPSVSYFCNMGPFRNCWIRLGYDPTKDYNSRIYQTLDFRIRALEGTKLKVETKRTYCGRKNSCPTLTKLPLASTHYIQNKCSLEERNYILKPNCMPPARQMFYQFCDIHIPEIQDMVTKLPRLPPSAKYDAKNGWLPSNFTDQCREISNRYVINAVKNAFLEDLEKQKEQPGSSVEEEPDKYSAVNVTSYCSTMLNNIRRGIYKSVDASGINTEATSPIIELDGESRDEVDASTQQEDFLQVDVNQVMNSMPERIEEDLEEEDISDMEIDLEAAEEVNNIILGIRDVI